MSSSIVLPRRDLAVWLPAFFSPSVYFLLLLLVGEFHLVPAPPEALVAPLFFGIPVLALFVCEAVVWRSEMTRGGKAGWMLLTLLGMLVQFGGMLFVVITIISAAIAYPQAS